MIKRVNKCNRNLEGAGFTGGKEAPRRRQKLKGALKNPKLSIKMEGAKATQGARNDVQKSMKTEPVRLSDRTPANLTQRDGEPRRRAAGRG